MIKLLGEQKELSLIYSFRNDANTSRDYAYNLGYKHGASTWNNDYFNPYLNKLIKQGILIKMYDFIENGIREAIYSFSDGTMIEFVGENHMTMRLFYNY